MGTNYPEKQYIWYLLMMSDQNYAFLDNGLWLKSSFWLNAGKKERKKKTTCEMK